MKVKFGELTVRQLMGICNSKEVDHKGCPFIGSDFACDAASSLLFCDLDEEIDLPDELLPKPVLLCRLRNEDRCSMYCDGFDTSCDDYKPVEEEKK